MNLKQFVVELSYQDVELWVEGDACFGQSQRLCVSAPEGVLTPETRDLLAKYKAELILLLDEKNVIALKRSAPEAIAMDTDFPLIKVDRTQKLPLSFAQERIWLLSQLEPDNPFYNELLALRLHGHLNIVALEQSLDKIIARHEALRTNFHIINEQPVQVIAESLTLSMPIVDLTELPEGKREIALQQLATAEAIRSFDLASSPLIRASVVKRKEVEHVLLLTIHHIVFDGWSTSVLMRELASIYSALCNNSSPGLPELPIQYADFAIWQRQLFQTEVLQTQINYWKQLLKNAPTLLELPTDRPRRAVQTFRGARQHIELSLELSEALANFSRQERATLFMTLFTAFVTLLYRYTGSDDIVAGTPIANRDRLEVEGLIGFFVNTLVLRTDLSGNPSFQQLLNRVRQLTLEAYAHSDLPFEELVKALQPQRDLSHTPLFQVLFVLQNIPVSGVNLTGLTVSSLETESTTAKFDLSLVMENTATGLVGMWEYNTDLFDASTIKRMALHFVTLLEAIVTNPIQQISQLPLLTEVEQRKLLVEWNDTQADYPDCCIHQLFEEQVQRTPDAVAVVFGNEQLTYNELNYRANQLAHYLKSLGVSAEVLVGLCVERSIEMVVGLLGILKAGGAYVPLDPEYPQERLSFMLEDTQLSVLLTQEKLVNKLGDLKACVICLDSNWDIIDQQTQQNPTTSIKAQDLAYVMYTSGSTGQSKGVSIAHQGVVRLVKENDYASFSAEEVFLQFAPISFDAATFEIWGSLLNGRRLIIFPSNTPSINELGQVIEQYQVTTLWLTAGLFHLIVDENINALRPLRQLLAGGDILSVTHVQKFLQTVGNCQLINGYGPTENTTFTCCYPIPKSLSLDVSVPIGRPIANTQVYILDKNLQPVPIGVPGELHISGAGLARGYFNRPELTQEKFIPNSFEEVRQRGLGGFHATSFNGGNPRNGVAPHERLRTRRALGSKLYKTGDLARYLPDGNIEYLGRCDNQVKIRGFRIELGEIEAVLSQHIDVRASCVITREDTRGDKCLVAYVVAHQDCTPTLGSELRQFLKAKLPDYMVPQAIVILESLPLTPNGKVDRHALPAPDLHSQLSDKYVAPRNPIEQLLAQIWEQVLKVEQVSIHDNFFELGGHSLLATQLVSRIRNIFKVELALRELFAAATVAQLAHLLLQLQQQDLELSYPAILPRAKNAQLPLSFGQQRLLFLDQFEPNSAFYNIPLTLCLIGTLNQVALEQSLHEIIARHEALRTNFVTVDGQSTQIIQTQTNWKLSVIDCKNLPLGEQEIATQQLVQQQASQSFDLTSEPLIRTTLIVLSETKHVLSVCMHHIVSDGWSIDVFIQELAALYNAYLGGQISSLAPLPVQYADFAIWQRNWLQGDVLQTQLSYWLQQLADAPALLSLPTDRPRPAVQSFTGAHQEFALSVELTSRLAKLSQQQGVTLFMTLLAAFDTLLYRYTGVADILVGSPIANRNRSSIEGLIGFFVNTLVMRTSLAGNPTFLQLLDRVREIALEAYAHQDLPFEMLVEALQPERNLSHTPLFQVMFVLQNTLMSEVELTGLSVTPLSVESATAKFDLTLSMENTILGLVGVWEYNTDLFDSSTIERMTGHFVTLLEGIVANPIQQISQLPLLTDVEQHQLLVEWNNTQVDYSQDKCIHQLFEEQVQRTPDAVAVVWENQQLTYYELNCRANQLAHYLKSLGVSADVLVGLCVERSLLTAIALVGILKTGGAYVPLDPEYPIDRLSFMLEDTQLQVLLTQEHLVKKLPQHQVNLVFLNEIWSQIAQNNQDNLTIGITASHLANVIYTSGSTGKPKGVMVEHRGLCNLAQAQIQIFGIHPDNRVLQFASFSFDACISEVLMTLAAGATLYLGTKADLMPGVPLMERLRNDSITHVTLPPSALAVLPTEKLKALQTIIVAGEACSVELVKKWSALRNFFNAYGPTEASVCATIAKCTLSDDKISIGRPIANTQIYILDSHLQPVPIGVPGELHIGGAGLARGYFNRPELTQEKFIPNPFEDALGSKLYKTGDLARYLPDGNIEYLGRIDNQVKIRGFRIELGEIEAVLSQCDDVQASCVIARVDTPGDKRLVAYVVAHQQHPLTISQLRSRLSSQLPQYMIPHAFVMLESLPLTPNGKVDRRALPAPDSRVGLEVSFVAPRNQIEEILAQIWAEVLRVEQVGIHDNFFELGGDSILSIQIISRAKLARLQLTLKQLFAHQTIAQLAAVAGTIKMIEVGQGLVTGTVPLTPIQHWFKEQNLSEPHHFNQSFVLCVSSDLKPELLKQVLQQLLVHHDALRLRFTQSDLTWQQFHSNPGDNIAFYEVDLSTLPEIEQKAAIEAKAASLQASLNLDSNLVQVAFFRLGIDKKARLLIIIHHLVIDGVSWRILLEDLQKAYQQLAQGKAMPAAVNYALPAKTTSFKDWSYKLIEYAQSQAFKSEIAYWLNKSRLTVPPIPVDYTQGANTVEAASTVSVSLNEAQTRALLLDVPKAYNTQINDVLLTALVLVLSQWTNSNCVLFNLEGHGRQDIIDGVDLSRTIGWFTTIFPVLVELQATENPVDALKSVKEQLRAIPNQGIGYGLLRYLSQDAEISTQLQALPQAEISFNYLGQFDHLNTSSWMQPASESVGHSHSLQNNRAHLLDINSIITGERLQIEWTYSTNVHLQATIEDLAQKFVSTLQRLIAHCSLPESGGYTPTDFPLVKLNQLELDQLLASLVFKNQSGKTNWRNIEDIYPLSGMQQGMLFESLYAPDSGVYFEQVSCTLSGKLNVAAFEQAWQQVVARHSILRTAFIWEQLAQPLQVVYRQVDVNLNSHDWQQLSAQQQQQQLELLLHSQRQQGFQLSVAPLMHLALIQLSADTYQFIWSSHHLLLDGWSMPLVFKDLFYFYQAISQGETKTVQPTASYRNYIAWLQKQDLVLAEQFWRRKLQGFTAPTFLSVDKPSSDRKHLDSSYSEQHIQLTVQATAAVGSFARQHQLTMNNLVQATWAILLCRYSQETDIVFGATVSGRPPSLVGIESMVGLFINTLPVRVQVSADTQVLALLKDLQTQAFESEQYSYSSLVEIQGFSDVPRGTPLFESIVVFENYPVDTAVRSYNYSFDLENIHGIEQTNYPLTVIAAPGKQLLVKISYDTNRFDDAAITRLLGHFQRLLEGIVANPEERISQLPMLTQVEQHQLLVEWNNTQVDYCFDKCIHQLFEEQSLSTPDAVAVVFDNQQLSYYELNYRANQLAHYLRSLGVAADVLVGICVERSLEMVVGLLGILKAGGAYVPLDPEYPQERLSFMLEDAQVPVLLTQQRLLEKLPEHRAQVVCLDTDWQSISQSSQDNPITGIQATNLTYVIYTSGSTGKPKGAMNTHLGIYNRLLWMQQAYQLRAVDCILQKTPFSFDVSVWEFFWPLLTGARLVVAKPGGHKDSAYLVNLILEQQVTTLHFVPSMLQVFLEEQSLKNCSGLKRVICSGEALPKELQERFFARLDCELHNLYGPTEAAIDVTFWQCKQKSNLRTVPIGRPIANTQIYILDSHLQPVPIGVPGELHIGGLGLARGYLNRPQLTQEKFIPNPFEAAGGSRLYKTGDKARYLSDGIIEYLGRTDNQVKIRGFRIELGEIEAALNTHPQIQQAIVIVTEYIPGNKRLIAYVVKSDKSLTTNQLRQFLKQQLPEYMVPSGFVTLDNLPLTPNGKIDRLALPTPDGEILREHKYVAPRTAIEQILTNIWQQLLLKEKVSIHDNFFEIGGDSILSIQVVSRAKNSGIQITPKQIFQNQTIAELAKVANTIVGVECKQGIVTGVASLTPIQHRYFAQNRQEAHHYNQSVLLQIPKRVQSELIPIALKKLLEHHDALRLKFTSVAAEHKQINQGLDDSVPFAVVDLSSIPRSEQPQALEKIATEYQASLNLSTGQIMQVVMFNLGEESDARLLIIIHHLAVDGVSWRILLTDLEKIYQQLTAQKLPKLSAKTTAFIDWAEKLNDYAQLEIVKQELDYWLNQPWSKITLLPSDYADIQQENTVGSAAHVSVKLSVAETQSLLLSVNEAYNTQINDILLSALVVSIAKWTRNSTVLIDLEGHGREELFSDVDLSRTVGWFTSLFPVLLQLHSLNKPGEIIKSIKEQLRVIPNHGIGYGILRYLCKDTTVNEQIQSIPASEISFNYLGQFDSVQSETGWKFAPESTGYNQSLKQTRDYLLDINALVVAGELRIYWTYDSHVHTRYTMEKLAQSYIQAIRSIIEHCQLEENKGYTPSDFPDAQLNQLELDELLTRFKTKNIESIYPLSPSQQGMLIETLSASESGIHIEQCILNLLEELDLLAFERAWQRIVERHSILRTAFIWEAQDEPLQVVLKEVKVSLEMQDWRGLSLSQQQEKLETYLSADRLCGFNMTKPPLMRLALFQIGSKAYQFIWTFHHILIDGWCMPLILKEVFAFYKVFSTGQDLSLESSYPYKDYIAWLKQQDLSQAEAFWRSKLQGFTSPTPLGIKAEPVNLSAQEERYGEQKVYLTASATAALQSLVRQHHLTLNILVQGVWGLLLSRYSGLEDVVFGATFSGRPPELVGVESMLGLFINTLPIRLQVSSQASLWSWLRDIQDQTLTQRDYEYCAQGQIHEWSEVPSSLPLYESLLVFENYPVDSLVQQSADYDMNILNARSIGAQTKYALTILVKPGSELEFCIIYNRHRYDNSAITRILEHFQALLNSIFDFPEQYLGTLMERISADQIPQVRPPEKLFQKEQQKGFDAPRNHWEFQLVQIWSDILDIHPVSIRDNFFELGGHSLLAVRLMSQIQKHFQINLPLAILFQNPTIEQLANFLSSSTNSLPWSALVPIKTNGNQSPLFCIHPAGGNVLCYHHLAYNLSSERPFYGLQSVGLNPQNQPHTSIEQMATHYIKELQTVQPHGPYFLCGWSLGGLIAFEMSQQLSHKGEQIALLALLDSYPLSLISKEPEDHAALLVGLFKEHLNLCVEQLRKFESEKQLIYVMEQAKQKNIILEDFDLDQAPHLLKIYQINAQAGHNYKPQYYSGSIVLFQASETDADVKYTWNELVKHIETDVVPGNHQNMVKPPHVQTLVQKLQKFLE